MQSEGNVQLFIAIQMSQFPAKAQAENCLWKNLFKNVLACIIDEVHCIMNPFLQGVSIKCSLLYCLILKSCEFLHHYALFHINAETRKFYLTPQ